MNTQSLRERFEQREHDILSPYAAHAADTRGRAIPEDEHPYRTAFQRDRDRIIHTKSFRRLKRKTQVFLASAGDHYRTRLTHTLEVAQIARTTARALFLNEDLIEAIALGHDLGHTPFGHAGEAILNQVYRDGFTHAEQSLRIVDKLESRRTSRGLNLTYEVRDGIVNHSRCKALLQGDDSIHSATLEGDVVSVCDAIAYINHDIEDAIRGGIIHTQDLPQECVYVLGTSSSERINTMVTALIEGSQNGKISMTPDVREATWTLRAYLYAEVYPSESIRSEIRKAERLLEALYGYLMEHPVPEMLDETSEDPLDLQTVDMIAGMTDAYALEMYSRYFLPFSWPSWTI